MKHSAACSANSLLKNVGLVKAKSALARAFLERQKSFPTKKELSFSKCFGEIAPITAFMQMLSSLSKSMKGVTKVAVKEKVRVKVKGYDHAVVDAAAAKIVETAKRTGSRVAGPVPLPTDKEVVTILRAVHKYKDSREQFEQRTHKRLIDVIRPTNKTIEALQSLELPAGVEISMDI